MAGRLPSLKRRVHAWACPATSVAAGEPTRAGRGQATTGGGRAGGQHRPEGRCRHAPDADLRGGTSRVQLRVPTRAEDALYALTAEIERRKINWILDADVTKRFDRIERGRLVELLQKRTGDCCA